MHNSRVEEVVAIHEEPESGVSEGPTLKRRALLRGAAAAPAVAAGVSMAASLFEPSTASADVLSPLSASRRRNEAYQRRVDAAHVNRHIWKELAPQAVNADESYGDKRASFTKTLPHDELGLVLPLAYDLLRVAMSSGDPAAFDRIPLAPGAVRKLANPQAALAYVTTGLDPHFGRIAAPPSFTSAVTSAEMADLYWAALTRDVSFRTFDTDPLIARAIADLNRFSAAVGPKVGGAITPATLFRGLTPGDLVGPYVSQFLWRTIPFGPTTIEQRYRAPVAADFMTTFPAWLAIQRGANPTSGITYGATPRFIHDGRTLGEYVHQDFSYQAFVAAALIALSFGPAALAPGNPYVDSGNQGGFATLGGPDILDLVARAANQALRTAWWQKWSAHRRLRPEAYGARVDVQRRGAASFGIPSELMGSDAVAATVAVYGTALHPQAFPEGSPTHPAFPAGHAAIAGACVTVLKALFNESFVIPSPVQASVDGTALEPWTGAGLTLGGECNKLANNIAIGRNLAGVHWRSDGDEGVRLGEQVALALLADESRTYNEDFPGFELSGFDGSHIYVVNGEIIVT